MNSSVHTMLQDIFIPEMAPVRQILPRPVLRDVAGSVREELRNSGLAERLTPGMTVAVSCGSRGISNIAVIMREIIGFCKSCGANPFIFPAMGSHGASTAEGQRQVLAGLGVTEETCGCPIISSMETVQLGRTPEGYPVYLDKAADGADGIIVVGRVKAHTAFRGPYESGLMKMIAVGMGKCRGAEVCHTTGFRLIHEIMPAVARVVLERKNILLGFAILENAYDETCRLCAMQAAEIPEKEPELLKQAKAWMGRIYLPQTDILVVDQIGKNISGDGGDPNIIGNFCSPYADGGIQAKKRVVLDLTPETQGNAMGVGMYDATTMRLYRKIDFDKTYTNPLISTAIHMAKIPMVLDSDHDAVAAAIKASPEIDRWNPRIIRIQDSAHIQRIHVSKAHEKEVLQHPRLEFEGPYAPMPFDEGGDLF